MKKFSKVFALVLAFVMLMSVNTFAATLVEGTNGKTINLSFDFSSDNAGNTKVTEVASGNAFYLWVNFSGNPSTYDEDTETAPGSIHGIDAVIGYDAEKMTFGTISNRAISPLTKEASWDTGVCVFQWGTAKGGIFDSDEEVVLSEGSLVRIKVTANADLTENDLKSISFLKIANKGSYKAETLVSDDAGKLFTVVVPDAPAAADPTPVTGAAVDGAAVSYNKGGDFVDTFAGAYSYTATIVPDATEYTKAGFIWSSSASDKTFEYVAVDANDNVLAGTGALNYTVIMYGVPEGVTITGTPYYYAN